MDQRDWADSDMGELEAAAWLEAAVDVGTSGAALEQARAATYAALQSQPANVGFRRPDADLAVLILSDEDDATAIPSLDDFRTWLDNGPGLERVTVHAIVSTSPQDPCGSGSWGQDHLALVDSTGGSWLSICEVDYGPFLSALGQFVIQQALPRRFLLSAEPEPASLQVEVRLIGGFVDELSSDRFLYDGATREVVVTDDQPPAAGSSVRIRYQAVPDPTR